VADKIKRLYRSRHHRILGGVCGGIAEYFNIDPAMVRILWVIFTLAGGAGLLTYIAALFIMENNPSEVSPDTESVSHLGHHVLWGTVLIVLGLVMMFTSFKWFYFPFFYIRWEVVLAALFIAVGVVIVIFGKGLQVLNEPKEEGGGSMNAEPKAGTHPLRRLYRSQEHRIVFGICGGLGEYFNLDPVLIRIGWLLLSFFSGGAGFLIYLVLLFVIPEES
jgi:phage shock protein C